VRGGDALRRARSAPASLYARRWPGGQYRKGPQPARVLFEVAGALSCLHVVPVTTAQP